MREFRCSFDGEVVDLDDPNVYEYLPQEVNELRERILFEIGYSHVWQKYWHPNGRTTQPERVEILVKEFADNYQHNHNNVLWLQEFLFRFIDEVENMC